MIICMPVSCVLGGVTSIIEISGQATNDTNGLNLSAGDRLLNTTEAVNTLDYKLLISGLYTILLGLGWRRGFIRNSSFVCRADCQHLGAVA